MSYAADTTVSCEKSQSEIQRMLMRAGAERYMVGFDKTQAAIGFHLRGKSCRFILPLPDRMEKEFWFTKTRHNKRTEAEAFAAWEQACRSRWRAMGLSIKAKLESVEIGLRTFEQEFLADIVTENGQTVGDRIIPQINEDANAGKPLKLLGWGE